MEPIEKERERDDDGPVGLDPDVIIEEFYEMKLKKPLLRGIYAYGFEKPSAIQQRAIIPCNKGFDVLVEAQSGTDKTATFSISILQQIDTELRECQALILTPTRELAQQIQDVVIALSVFMDVQCHALIGGINDVRKLRMGVHLVVGTPERVYDMINQGTLRTNFIKIFVLDEADGLLSRGFENLIYAVFRKLNCKSIQVVLLSATMPADVLAVTERFMRHPIRILVKKEELTPAPNRNEPDREKERKRDHDDPYHPDDVIANRPRLLDFRPRLRMTEKKSGRHTRKCDCCKVVKDAHFKTFYQNSICSSCQNNHTALEKIDPPEHDMMSCSVGLASCKNCKYTITKKMKKKGLMIIETLKNSKS